jgi:hypothetical protein
MTSTATVPRADELRREIEQTHAELKTLRPGPESKDDVDRLHAQLRSLNAELLRVDPPAPQLVAPVNVAAPERIDLSRADGLARFADFLNGAAVEVEAGPRERLAELRRERRCIPAMAKNAEQFAVLDAKIAELEPVVEALNQEDAAKAEAEAEAERNTPEVLAAAEIANLEASRSALALRILEGDTDAQSEFDATEAKIAEAHRQVELRKLAEVEKERLRVEAERAAAAEAERAEAARIEFLNAEYETRMGDVVLAIAALRDRVRDLLPVDREMIVSSASGQGSDDLIATLCAIALNDAGIHRRALPNLPFNVHRAQILDIWPIPETVTHRSEATTGRKCTVCTHKRRDEVERALANGTPATEIASKFQDLRRHAIRRHRDHGKETA